MLFIEVSLTLLPLSALLLFAFLAGFLLRSGQIRSSHKKVLELEKEMLSNHAEILDLQKEKALLLRQMKDSRIPVIPMKTGKEDGDHHDHKSRQAK